MDERGAKLLLRRVRCRPIRALNPTVVWSLVFPFVLATTALGTFPKSSTAAAQGEKHGRREKRRGRCQPGAIEDRDAPASPAPRLVIVSCCARKLPRSTKSVALSPLWTPTRSRSKEKVDAGIGAAT
jgi:hypothetical protein